VAVWSFTVKTIDPNLFTQLMRLPVGMRVDILEFLGATPIEDTQLRAMLDVAKKQLQNRPSRSRTTAAA